MKRIIKRIALVFFYGLLGLCLYLALDIAMWFFPSGRGLTPWQWDSSGVVAVGNNYSIELLTRTAHPFLAEYDQKINIYGGTERVGEKLKTVELHMNTGGRTDIKVYTDKQSLVYLEDRFGQHLIDLNGLEVRTLYKAAKPDNSIYIGTFSGEAYPLKFIPSKLDE